MSNKKFIIITGPTGVGKSALAEQLASLIEGEIINADMGQFYTPLTIGTAKPDYKNSPSKHHLFDVLDAPINFSVTAYRETLLATMTDIWQRGKMPLIVGGSGFYVRSLFFPPQDPIQKIPLDDHIESMAHNELWPLLYQIDPQRAEQLHPNDTYRIKRALAIWYQTGQKPSSMQPAFISPGNGIVIFVTRQREQLYTLINERVHVMLDAGWVDEVAQLNQDWHDFLLTKKIIGYPEVIEYLKNNISTDQLRSLIQQKTRNYAKRQWCFWQSLKKDILTFDTQSSLTILEPNLTFLDLPLYIKQLLPLFEKGIS